MIGLGVGVDYALFIVTRFREALRGGRPPEDAAVLAMRTAGRTVLIAGTTVIIGMLGPAGAARVADERGGGRGRRHGRDDRCSAR